MKSRILAALLALFFGGIGIHKFYLRDSSSGIFYIILQVLGSAVFKFPIGSLLGWIDALVLFTMSDERFDKKYNKHYEDRYDRRENRYESRYPSRDSYSRSGRSGGYQVRRDTYKEKRQTTPPPVPKRPRENPFKKTGISKYKEFDLEGAIEDFEKGLELDPKDIALHFNIACAFSLTEQPEKGFYHLSKAVENGFKDFEKIKTHDDLAFLRIQPEFEAFEQKGYRLDNEGKEIPVTSDTDQYTKEEIEIPDDILQNDVLLSQLQKLSELRNKGLLSEKEYLMEKEKLIGR